MEKRKKKKQKGVKFFRDRERERESDVIDLEMGRAGEIDGEIKYP